MNWLHSLQVRLFGFDKKRRASKRVTRGTNRFRRLSLEYLENRLAPSVSMVADINNYTVNSTPYMLTNVNGTLFFAATTNSGDDQLFKSDGTASGTVQLTFGTRVSSFHRAIAFNGKLFFEAFDSTLSYDDMWVTDGTVAGTVPVLSGGNNIPVAASTPQVIVGSKFYFQAYDYSNNLYDLWVSDGTNAGTHPVQPGNLNDSDNLLNLTNVNGKLFFESFDSSTSKYTLWTSNGTAAGTSMVTELTANQATNFTVLGTKLYFEMFDSTTSSYALWKSDGTAAGTTMVTDINSQQFYSLISFNNQLFFQVYDPIDTPTSDWALWTSDGTAAGTHIFKYNGNTTAVPTNQNTPQIVFNSALYFQGYSTTFGYSLWKTDGVSGNNNTGPVQTTPTNGNPGQFAVVNGTELYFVATNTVDSRNLDLWKTNGTDAGTAPVQTSGFARNIYFLTPSAGKLFFRANDVDANGNSPHGVELWCSDGTNAGTAMVIDINTTTFTSEPSNLIAVGNEIFFDAFTYAPVNGTFLWQSDGTAANTAPVQTSTGTVPTNENNAIAVGNSLFFTAQGANGNDLWTSGTSLKSAVEIFANGGANPFASTFDSSNADAFANLNGLLYFGAKDAATSSYALWKSNGTAAGTTVVADLDPSNPLSHLTAVGNDLFWQQYDSARSTYAVWEYNGTTASLVSDISANGLSNLTAVGSSIFFQVLDSVTSKYALWTSNGAATTMLGDISSSALVDLIAFNGKLFFAANDSTLGYYKIWTSDGTAAGTTAFLNAGGQPVPVSSTPFFTLVGSELFFETFDPDPLSLTNYLGKTDGTAAGTGTVQAGGTGTTMVQYPTYLANDNGTLVFQGYDSAHGFELWQSDGTASGTLLTADIIPGPASSFPSNLTVAGTQVFFSAGDPIHRGQLWTATIAATVVTAGVSGPGDGVTEQHRAFVLTASDSNSGNNSAGFSFAINWGDGSSQTVTGLSGLSTDHQYATVGTFTISVAATNLADNVTGAAATQVETITQTEIQGGNLALGGAAGNDAFAIAPGTSGTFTVKVNGNSIITNFKPAAGQQIFLYPGNGTTTITINDSGTTADAFVLGTGYVTFKGTTFVPQAPGTWTINGNNGADTFTISGAANASITGGSGKNTFKFVTGGSLTGAINGGSGTMNSLDYSGYATSGVIVDLPLGSATAVGGGISHIRNVTGSKNGGDILVGDANPNILKALKGHNILIGGSGGGDTLTSGGADILIAGTTSYDTNIAALQTILNTWKTSTPANYSSVVATISSNSFADPLNSSTVFDSGTPDVADTLNGKGTSMTDWFFAHTSGGTNPNDTLTGVGSGDTVTSI